MTRCPSEECNHPKLPGWRSGCVAISRRSDRQWPHVSGRRVLLHISSPRLERRPEKRRDNHCYCLVINLRTWNHVTQGWPSVLQNLCKETRQVNSIDLFLLSDDKTALTKNVLGTKSVWSSLWCRREDPFSSSLFLCNKCLSVILMVKITVFLLRIPSSHPFFVSLFCLTTEALHWET